MLPFFLMCQMPPPPGKYRIPSRSESGSLRALPPSAGLKFLLPRFPGKVLANVNSGEKRKEDPAEPYAWLAVRFAGQINAYSRARNTLAQEPSSTFAFSVVISATVKKSPRAPSAGSPWSTPPGPTRQRTVSTTHLKLPSRRPAPRRTDPASIISARRINKFISSPRMLIHTP